MADVLFRLDVDAPPERVIAALRTGEGIRSFWTARADVPESVGGTLRLEFDAAPAPFDLRLERADRGAVVWRTETFPPHWVGTQVEWQVESRDGGATISFRHAGFADEADAGRAAYTWGQIMTRLQQYAETGQASPLFT